MKISASGPIPTSRYCDHAPFSMSTCFSFIAASEPGFSFERSSPISSPIEARISAAAAGLPRARSSMTRSSMEMAKVTPAAFNACRSTGGNSQGIFLLRASGGVLAMIASMLPRASPSAARAAAAGSSASHKSRMVGNAALMSIKRDPSRLTIEGPSSPGFHTRPTSTPSAGRAAMADIWSFILVMSQNILLVSWRGGGIGAEEAETGTASKCL